MLIGYARISITDQTLALQQDALKAAGCEKIFTDTASGSSRDRPGLVEAVRFARKGDTLVVWRLDRLGRSLAHLIETVRDLQERGVHFRSLQEQLDTGTSGGKLVFHVFGALAEFERDLIRERTMAGLASARSRGRGGGRRGLNQEKVRQLRTLAADRTNSVAAICKTLDISRATFYRYVKQQDIDQVMTFRRIFVATWSSSGRTPSWWPVGLALTISKGVCAPPSTAEIRGGRRWRHFLL